MDRSQVRALIERYQRGEDVDITALPEPSQNHLRERRALRDQLRVAFEKRRAEEASARERALEVAYLEAGGTPDGWRKEGPGICASDRAARTLTGTQASGSLVDLRTIS